MNLRTALLSAVFALALPVAAHAQLGVYGAFTAERISSIQCAQTTGTVAAPVVSSTCAASGAVDPYGFLGGVYYDFLTLGPVRLGVDARADLVKGNKSATEYFGGPNAVRMNSVLGGVRASFHTRFAPLKPYAQASFGWTKDRPKPLAVGLSASNVQYVNLYATNNTNTNYFTYRVYGGLDTKVLSFMDVRLPELGFGQILGSGTTNPVGHGTSYPTMSISAGVVFHLP